LTDAVERWQPDAVLLFGWSFRSHLQALRHFHGRVPVLFRGDSTLVDEGGGLRTWARRLFLRWVYRHVDAALYVGQHNRRYYEAHGLTGDQLFWVPHVVENERFYDPDGQYAAEAQRWRHTLGIQADDRAVLFAGKLEHKKAPDVFLDAFLRLEATDRHLILAGSGPLEEALRQQAGAHPRVHFLGFQNQSRMPIVYRLGDVFVLPSRGPGETWGLAINEAMACGRPIVTTTRVGCAPDLVDEANGRAVVPDAPRALRDALAATLRPGVPEAMGRVSRKRIEAWSIDEAATRTQQALHQLLAHS
jgi:glycosyltransferase involved in cell wall biosynthesis